MSPLIRSPDSCARIGGNLSRADRTQRELIYQVLAHPLSYEVQCRSGIPSEAKVGTHCSIAKAKAKGSTKITRNSVDKSYMSYFTV